MRAGFFLFSRRFGILCFIVLLLCFIWGHLVIQQKWQEQLAWISEKTVSPAKGGSVWINPLTGNVYLTDLLIPQFKQVGVSDEVLSRRPLIELKDVSLSLDWRVLWHERKLIIHNLSIRDLQLGALVGSEIPRMDLAYLPGILMATLPKVAQGPERTLPYELSSLTIENVDITLEAVKNAEKNSVMIHQGKLSAKSISNRELPKGQVGVMGEINYQARLSSHASISLHLSLDSFYQPFKRANGRLIIEGKRIPAQMGNLLLENLGFGMAFTGGEVSLDMDMRIENSRWRKIRDDLVFTQVRLRQTRKYTDPYTKAALRYFRSRGGNARFNDWLIGTLASFQLGPFRFNPGRMF
jgi:hypothetical protein